MKRERELLPRAEQYPQAQPPGKNTAHDGTLQAGHPLPVNKNRRRGAHRPLHPPPPNVVPTATATAPAASPDAARAHD